ncbi:hypothetical protein BLOT_014402 [Blomia tropicalis]|nr:hypothetical protein BLOT_014402 [Blomia tropicalis]
MLFDAILYSTLLYGTPNSSSRRHLKWDVTTSFFYDRVRAKCFKPESMFHHQNVIILSSSNKCELNLVLFTTSDSGLMTIVQLANLVMRVCSLENDVQEKKKPGKVDTRKTYDKVDDSRWVG